MIDYSPIIFPEVMVVQSPTCSVLRLGIISSLGLLLQFFLLDFYFTVQSILEFCILKSFPFLNFAFIKFNELFANAELETMAMIQHITAGSWELNELMD